VLLDASGERDELPVDPAILFFSMGWAGKSRFIFLLKKALYWPTSAFRSAVVSSVSCLTPRFVFIASSIFSKLARSRCSATEENIMMKRR